MNRRQGEEFGVVPVRKARGWCGVTESDGRATDEVRGRGREWKWKRRRKGHVREKAGQ